jgi:DNA-binding MarR family transcriptional regulator
MKNDLGRAAEHFLNLMDRLRKQGPKTAPPKEANISPSQLTLISFLNANPGCGIQFIASGLKISKPSVSVGVSQLEGAGFLTRQPDSEDGRAVQLYLTTKGQELHTLTHEFRCKKFEHLLEGLTTQERTILLELLERAIQNVEYEEKGKI